MWRRSAVHPGPLQAARQGKVCFACFKNEFYSALLL